MTYAGNSDVMDPRRIPLEGTFNFRDLGGYAAADGRVVRPGMLYRSDNFSKVPPRAHPRFTALGLRLLVDLRTELECRVRPNSLPGGATKVEHLPISFAPELEKKWSIGEQFAFFAGGGIQRCDRTYVLDCYTRLPQRAAPSLRRLLTLLQEPGNYPAVFHCMGGRDRTGFSAAMILSILGVPRPTILADYHLTEKYASPEVDRRIVLMRAMSLFRIPRETLREFLGAREEYLQTALSAIEQQYGSVEAYLRQEAGFSDSSAEALRSLLLVHPADSSLSNR